MLKPYCYAFVRTDIPPADQGVQLAHATLEAGKYFQHPDDTHMVVIGIKNREKLFKIAELLERKNIGYRMFFEPDDDMRQTAIATEAIYGSARKPFRDLELWNLA